MPFPARVIFADARTLKLVVFVPMTEPLTNHFIVMGSVPDAVGMQRAMLPDFEPPYSSGIVH